MNNTLAFQPVFRPPLFETYGCKDYRNQRELFERIDQILEAGKLDQVFQESCLAYYDKSLSYQNWLADQPQVNRTETPEQFAEVYDWQPPYNPYSQTGNIKDSWLHQTRTALRTNILRYVNQNTSLRMTSFALADSSLARWFCHVGEFGPVKPPSKSTVDRYEDWIPEQGIRELIQNIIDQVSSPDQNKLNSLGLSEPIATDEVWLDGTCLKANIHFPVDWVLLKDICRTLMLATIVIRKRGLKNRMPQSPGKFMRDMNKLVIEMTQCRRRKDSKKLRKKVLRKMIKLEKRIAKHAQKHSESLEQRWQETDLSQAQANLITTRIQGVIEQLPAALKQARERIIGERRVASSEKILSIYEADINVIVRGKSDAEVEFGNCLRIAEQRNGIIVDYHLYKKSVADNSAQAFEDGLVRMCEATSNRMKTLWTDRGMDSAKNISALESRGIVNGICPKSVHKLQEKMKDRDYADGQTRRSSTEARIGIFTNRMLGGLLRTKGFRSRKQSVGWAVLSHNLWVIARIDKNVDTEKEEVEPPDRKAA